MHAWLTSNIWSSLEVWFWRVQLWLSSRFFSSAEDRSSPRLPTHPQKNGREKIINKKKNLILYCLLCANVRPYVPLILTARQIFLFIERRVTGEEPGWRWRGSTTIDWQLFLKIPSLPSKRREARVKREINFNLLLRNYWLDSQCGGKEKACNTLMAVTVMSLSSSGKASSHSAASPDFCAQHLFAQLFVLRIILAEAFPLYTVIPNLLVQIKYVC